MHFTLRARLICTSHILCVQSPHGAGGYYIGQYNSRMFFPLWGKYLLSLKTHPSHFLQEAALLSPSLTPLGVRLFPTAAGWICCIAFTAVYLEHLLISSVSVSQWMESNSRAGTVPMHPGTLSASTMPCIRYTFWKWLLGKWMDVVSGTGAVASIPFHGHFF